MSLPSLASLLEQMHIEDDELALRASDATLKQSPGDLQAQHVRVVALLKLDRYDDALKALEAGGEKLKERADLEQAYALYKTGSPAAAAQLAEKSSRRASQHLEAQARYRTEDFKRAAELYRHLASNPVKDADADLRINLGAVNAQLEWAGIGELVENKRPEREDLDGFETAYNAACGSIARGELAQAEMLLNRAKDLCNALEDLNEEEQRTELLPITVQHIYVLSRLARTEEAESLANSIDISSISDVSLRYIAEVNDMAIRATVNPFMAQRVVTKDLESLMPDYPFQYQSSIMRRNRFASGLQALKFSGTAVSTSRTLSKQSLPKVDAFYTSLAVFNAAANAKSQTGREALKHILPVLEKRPNDLGLILTITQLYVLTGNSFAAMQLLESFLVRLEQSASEDELNSRFAPGLVGALISLYRKQGRKAQERTELAKATTYWRRKSKDRPAGIAHLFKATGNALLESQELDHARLAQEIFTDLHNANPNDQYAAAGLLAASAAEVGVSQSTSLNSIDRLIGNINVDDLESAGIAQPPSSENQAISSRKRPGEDTNPKKIKKLRKSRIPKDYDSSKTPDSERWLPLRDRSTYRPKGKKAKARQALFSQGTVAADESSRPAIPGGEVVKQKQAGPGQQSKKKKGKGNKW